jgi:hypothetical protein
MTELIWHNIKEEGLPDKEGSYVFCRLTLVGAPRYGCYTLQVKDDGKLQFRNQDHHKVVDIKEMLDDPYDAYTHWARLIRPAMPSFNDSVKPDTISVVLSDNNIYAINRTDNGDEIAMEIVLCVMINALPWHYHVMVRLYKNSQIIAFEKLDNYWYFYYNWIYGDEDIDYEPEKMTEELNTTIFGMVSGSVSENHQTWFKRLSALRPESDFMIEEYRGAKEKRLHKEK